MNNLKQKLLRLYFKEEILCEKFRLTPLRRFISSIGLDYTKLDKKQMHKFARSKRYKQYKTLLRIKKIADEHTDVKEQVILEHYKILSNIEETKSDAEIIKLLRILEEIYIIEDKFSLSSSGKFGATRGRYSTAKERMGVLKKKAIDVLNKGGEVSSSRGTIQFIGKGNIGKKAKKLLGANKIIFKMRIPAKTGLKYHHQTFKTPKGIL